MTFPLKRSLGLVAVAIVAVGMVLIRAYLPMKSASATAVATKGDYSNDPVASNGWKKARSLRVPLDTVQPWLTPLNFYGKVVDQNGEPVADATAVLNWTDLSVHGTSEATLMSQANGLFALTGKHGKALTVAVSKEGFIPSRSNTFGFFYAGEWTNFVGDPKNPVLFHMFRKGIAEPVFAVVDVRGIEGSGESYRIARDGTPLELNLKTGKIVSSREGHLRVESWSEDKGKKSGEKFNWRCRITVVAGSIKESIQEFDFVAPMDGYETEAVIDMPISDEHWNFDAERKYFLKFDNGTFARIKFKMIAHGDYFFHLESFLNPSGSRNLENDPQNVIKQ